MEDGRTQKNNVILAATLNTYFGHGRRRRRSFAYTEHRTQKSAQRCPGRLVGHICIHYDRGMCFMAACVAVSASVSVCVCVCTVEMISTCALRCCAVCLRKGVIHFARLEMLVLLARMMDTLVL